MKIEDKYKFAENSLPEEKQFEFLKLVISSLGNELQGSGHRIKEPVFKEYQDKKTKVAKIKKHLKDVLEALDRIK